MQFYCPVIHPVIRPFMHQVIHPVNCPVILIPPCYPPGYLPMPPCYPPPPWPSVYQPSYPHSYPSSYLMLPNLINQFIKLSNGDLQCEWIRTFFTNFLLFSKFKWVFVAYFKYLGNFVAFYDFSFGHFFKQKPLSYFCEKYSTSFILKWNTDFTWLIPAFQMNT